MRTFKCERYLSPLIVVTAENGILDPQTTAEPQTTASALLVLEPHTTAEPQTTA